MNLNQLRTFVAVANRLSFTLAAEDLDLTQPAVSLQVKALERSAHVRLLERHRNVLSLTEAGKALYDLALTMLSTERKANELLAELSGGRRGKLVIGANTTGGMYVVPELISAFRQVRADAGIDLHIEPAARILERIHQNIVDIGFVGGPLADERFEVEHVAPDALVLIFSPRHPFAGRQQVALHELADQPFIVPEPTSLMRMQFEQAVRAAGLQIRIALQLHEGEPVKKAVEANLGVGIISAFAIRRELAAGHLATAEVEGLRISRHLEMVWSRERYFSPLAVGFRDFARAFFAREYSDGHGAPA
jgi:DNA-binding transcriptional LysR family regulator